MGSVLKFPTLEERLAKEPHLFADYCWPHLCKTKDSTFNGMKVWVLRGEKCAGCGEGEGDENTKG